MIPAPDFGPPLPWVLKRAFSTVLSSRSTRPTDGVGPSAPVRRPVRLAHLHPEGALRLRHLGGVRLFLEEPAANTREHSGPARRRLELRGPLNNVAGHVRLILHQE